MVMENCKVQNFFVIKLSLSCQWHDKYHENLHYKSLLFPLNKDYQTSRLYLDNIVYVIQTEKKAYKCLYFDKITVDNQRRG